MTASNVIGVDTYIRADNASSWGTSSGGDVWTAATSNGTSTLSISSNTGLFNGVASGTSNIQLVGTKTAQNIELLIKAQMDSTSADGFSLVARSDGSNSGSANHYRCSLTNQLGINKVINGSSTSLGTFSLTVSTNTYYWVRFRVVGNTLKARVWQDGSSEPGTWGIAVTDSSLTATGRYGIRGIGNNVGNKVTVASFTATDASTIVDAPIRAVIATKVTDSTKIRTIARTLSTVSSKIRTIARTLNTVSSKVRTITRTLSTISTKLRTPVKTQAAKSTPIRNRVATKATRSITARTVIRTLKTASTQLRLLVTSAGISRNSYKNTVLADSPTAYYRLDESSGTIAHDSSGNGYDATVAGTFTLSQTGLLRGDTNTSILLDGITGFLSLPYTLDPSTWTSLTLEFWISISSGPQHVVITVDSSSTTLYLNGYIHSAGGSGDAILIDQDIFYAGSYSSGNLDEVALYQNVKLTAGQVYTHYESGIKTTKSTVIRTRVATKVTLSTPLRIVARGVTRISQLRAIVRTLVAKSIVLRALVRTLRTVSVALRVVIRTITTRSIAIRSVIATKTTRSTQLRTPVRTQVIKSATARLVAATKTTQSVVLRTVVGGITKLAQLRVIVRILARKSTPLRSVVATNVTRNVSTRVVARTLTTRTLALRVITTISGFVTAFSTIIRLVIRTLTTRSAPVRIVMRTLVTRSVGVRLRLVTKRTSSVAIRSMVVTRSTLLTQVRTSIRTSRTLLSPLRIVTRGITQVTLLRSVIYTLASISTSLRIGVRSTGARSLTMRVVARSKKTASSPARVIVRTPRSYSLPFRIKAQTQPTKSIVLRLRARSQKNSSVSLRVMVQAPAPLPATVPAAVATLSELRTTSCFVIPVPSFSYSMKGVTIDVPTIITAPLLQGGMVLPGQSFILVWSALPSANTQNALANGSMGSMTFAVHDGSAITAPVKVVSVVSGSSFITTVTVTGVAAISKRTILTQFM